LASGRDGLVNSEAGVSARVRGALPVGLAAAFVAGWVATALQVFLFGAGRTASGAVSAASRHDDTTYAWIRVAVAGDPGDAVRMRLT